MAHMLYLLVCSVLEQILTLFSLANVQQHVIINHMSYKIELKVISLRKFLESSSN